MKQLQNNFTTPEQSKRLLELGVPADSADMLWDGSIDANEGWIFEDFPTYTDKPFSYYQLLYRETDAVNILPCWSVGRLIEIYVYITSYEYVCLTFKKTFTPMDKILNKIEKDIKNGMLDFSKLED